MMNIRIRTASFFVALVAATAAYAANGPDIITHGGSRMASQAGAISTPIAWLTMRP